MNVLLATGATFVMVASLTFCLWQRLFGPRRSREILETLEGRGQRATRVQRPALSERWEEAVRQAGLSWSLRTYLTSMVAGLVVGALCWTGGHRSVALAAGVAGVFSPWGVVRFLQRRRAAQFAEQLPAALMLAANTIRAGGTMLHAVRAVARQMPDPIRSEFMRIEQALQLQVPLGTALDQARQRIGAPEFNAVVVACKVGGPAGADLDVVLEHIAREIVEDRNFRRAMRAASAEGRMSARIVTAIPFVVGAYFYWDNPRYFSPFLFDPTGHVILLGCAVSIALGWVIISRLTDVRAW